MSVSLAEIAAPFGRLPAGCVALVADELLRAVHEHHTSGTIGLNLQGHAIFVSDDGLKLMPGVSPYWLLPKERAAGDDASVHSDLYSVGALLVELLTGQTILDAGTPEDTAERLLKMTSPIPLANIWPTLPGFLERLMLGLLHPNPRRRPLSAKGARALIAEAVLELKVDHPNFFPALLTDPGSTVAFAHQQQAKSEGERATKLAADPKTRATALVSLERARALAPNDPTVFDLFGHAIDAQLLSSDDDSPELQEALAAIEASEPAPAAAVVGRAATLLVDERHPMRAIAMMKRALSINPDNKILAARLDDLAGPPTLWSAGGASVLKPPRSERSTPRPAQNVQPLETAPVAASVPSPLAGLGQAYASMEPRSRLFLLVLAFGALLSIALVLVQVWGANYAESTYNHLIRVKKASFDCEPGGTAKLIRVMQAAQLGEPEVANEILMGASAQIPMGTRCHKTATIFAFEAAAKAKGR